MKASSATLCSDIPRTPPFLTQKRVTQRSKKADDDCFPPFTTLSSLERHITSLKRGSSNGQENLNPPPILYQYTANTTTYRHFSLRRRPETFDTNLTWHRFRSFQRAFGASISIFGLSSTRETLRMCDISAGFEQH